MLVVTRNVLRGQPHNLHVYRSVWQTQERDDFAFLCIERRIKVQLNLEKETCWY